MGQIMIRSLDATVIEALRRRAAACGTSMEEQARRALTKAVGLERGAAARRLAKIRHTIGRIGGGRRAASGGAAGSAGPVDRRMCQRLTSEGGARRSQTRSRRRGP